MPRGYKRNWFAVDTGLIDNEKWMAMTWDERGKWLAVRCLAERQPTPDFKSQTYLALLLRKEGDEDSETTVQRLIDLRLLDVDETGRVAIHDATDYMAETSTERVQKYRETVRNGPKRLETPTRQDKTTHTARPPATAGGAGARERTPGESLKQFLERIGAPVPDIVVATPETETSNGETNGTEGRGDDDGKSRRKPRRRAAASG